MFLFLSKLLPLFLYPLGFACLMLILALILLWKRPAAAGVCITLALVALLLGSNGWAANQMLQSLEWQNIPKANLSNADAIVILGGATRPQSPPRPDVDLMESGDRVLYGAQLYRQGKAPLIIVSGGRIDWKGGGPPESADIARLLQEIGIPEKVIVQEPNSFNTYENAVNVRKIVQARNIKRILLVTSALHMPRALQIFRRQGMDVIPAPTDFLVTQQELREAQSSAEAVTLNLLPDADNLERMTHALKEYVGLMVYRLRGWV